MCDYPETHTTTNLKDFIDPNFYVNNIPLYYPIDTNYKSSSQSDMEVFEFADIWKDKAVYRTTRDKKTKKLVSKEWKPLQGVIEPNALELSLRHTQIFVIDIDGRDVDDKTFSWSDVPEILRSCPYTKSRTKKLPHFFFRLEGLPLDALLGEDTNSGKPFRNGSDNLNFCKGELLVNHTWEIYQKDTIVNVFNYNGTIPTLNWNDIKNLMKPVEVKRFEIQAGVRFEDGIRNHFAPERKQKAAASLVIKTKEEKQKEEDDEHEEEKQKEKDDEHEEEEENDDDEDEEEEQEEGPQEEDDEHEEAKKRFAIFKKTQVFPRSSR